MTRVNFLEKIRSSCEFDVEEVGEDTSLEDMDSVNFLTILALFKTNFGFTPNIDLMRSFKKLSEILDLAESKYEK